MRRLSILIVLFPFFLTAQQLYEIPKDAMTRWSTFENPNGNAGAGGKENKGAKGHAMDIIAAGKSRTLIDYKGAGIINRIWLTVNNRSPQMLRSSKIEMFWDESKAAAVQAPLGDFFGIGLGRRTPFESEFFSDPEGRSFTCFIPMPFKTAAKIVITNESKENITLFYDIDFTPLKQHEKEIYYFHAFWNRENKTTLGKDFAVLPIVEGRGRFLGMNVGVAADPIYGRSWFGEGEVKMFIDNDNAFPTIVGTGTEDYIGTAWGQGKYYQRFQGCPIADTANKQWCFYRYHVPDPIYFSTSLKVTLQKMGGEMTDFVRALKKKGARLQPVTVSSDNAFVKLLELSNPPELGDPAFPKGWTNYYREDDVSATAYFYLDRPESNLPPLAALQSRIADLSKSIKNP